MSDFCEDALPSENVTGKLPLGEHTQSLFGLSLALMLSRVATTATRVALPRARVHFVARMSTAKVSDERHIRAEQSDVHKRVLSIFACLRTSRGPMPSVFNRSSRWGSLITLIRFYRPLTQGPGLVISDNIQPRLYVAFIKVYEQAWEAVC